MSRWTKEGPKIDGVYWWRWPQNGQQIVFEVYGGKVFLGMQEQHPPTDGEWLGPIAPSDFEQLTRLREWKESAMTLLARYDSIAETFGGKLGSSKVDNLEQGVNQLRAELAQRHTGEKSQL